MRSPLVGFILSMKHDASPEIEGLTNTHLFGVPFAIPVGCRLILSIREAASSHRLPPTSGRRTSTFVVQDGSRSGKDRHTFWRLSTNIVWNRNSTHLS